MINGRGLPQHPGDRRSPLVIWYGYHRLGRSYQVLGLGQKTQGKTTWTRKKKKNIIDFPWSSWWSLRVFPGEGLILEAQERSGPQTMVLKEGNMEGDEARYLASYNHSRDPQVMSVIFMDFSSLRSWEGHISMCFPMVWKYVKVALKNIEYIPMTYSHWITIPNDIPIHGITISIQRWSTSFINSKFLQCGFVWKCWVNIPNEIAI